MKKAFFTVLAVMMVFAITGCPTDDNSGEPSGPFTVGFDKNNTDAGGTNASPPIMTVTPPATTVITLPVPPTRPGYIFTKWTLDKGGGGAEFTVDTEVKKDMTVYAQWQEGFLVTFDKNGGEIDAVPAIKTVVKPATTVGTLPTPPVREGFEFVEWNTNEFGGTTGVFTEATEVTSSITVFAMWKYVGGTPKLVDGKIVHNMPLMEISGDTVTWNEDNDGTISIGGGNSIDYLFPTDVSGQSALDFDYLIVQTTIMSGEEGTNTGVQLRQYQSGTAYAGGGTGKMPWLSNADGIRMVLDVSGAGTTGGFRIYYSGGGRVEKLRIDSVTFYKAPRFTVTFAKGENADAGAAALEKTVANVWGKDDNHDGYGVGAANWPAVSAGQQIGSLYFLTWDDSNNTSFGPTTAITADTALTAKWTNQAPPMVHYVQVRHNHQAAFKFPILATGKTWGDVKSVSFSVKVTDPVAQSNHASINAIRNHIMYVGEGELTYAANGRIAAAWGGNRIGVVTGKAGYDAAAGGNFGNAIGAFNEWVTFTVDMRTQSTGDYWGTWNGDATKAKTADLTLGVGPAVNNNVSTVLFGYFIKDVFITFADDSKLDAEVKTAANVGQFWSGSTDSTWLELISEFRPLIED